MGRIKVLTIMLEEEEGVDFSEPAMQNLLSILEDSCAKKGYSIWDTSAESDIV